MLLGVASWRGTGQGTSVPRLWARSPELQPSVGSRDSCHPRSQSKARPGPSLQLLNACWMRSV